MHSEIMVHHVILSDSSSPYDGEVVGTFVGPVPAKGDVINKKVLGAKNPKLKELPRYHEARYMVTSVEWELTDEGAEMVATVYVIQPPDKARSWVRGIK